MAGDRTPGSALGLFWEDADLDDSGQDPIERELNHRLEAVTRYARMIEDACACDLEGTAVQLERQLARERELVQGLREALRRTDADRRGRA